MHKPYTPPAPYRELFTAGFRGELRLPAEPSPADERRPMRAVDRAALDGRRLPEGLHRYVVGLYDGEIRSADRYVAAALDALARAGLADDTVVVFSADHGEELGDRQGYYYHGNSLFDGTVRVPLIVRWPGRVPTGRSVAGLCQNFDVLPTLLEWAGVEAPDHAGGCDGPGKVVELVQRRYHTLRIERLPVCRGGFQGPLHRCTEYQAGLLEGFAHSRHGQCPRPRGGD